MTGPMLGVTAPNAKSNGNLVEYLSTIKDGNSLEFTIKFRQEQIGKSIGVHRH